MLAFEIKQSCPRREREGPIFLSPKWLDKVPQTFDRSNHKKSLALAVGAWSFSKKKKYRRPSGGKHKQKLKKKKPKRKRKKKGTWSILTFASWLTVIFMHSFFFFSSTLHGNMPVIVCIVFLLLQFLTYPPFYFAMAPRFPTGYSHAHQICILLGRTTY